MEQLQQTTQLQINRQKYQRPSIVIIEMVLESTLAASKDPLDIPGQGGNSEEL